MMAVLEEDLLGTEDQGGVVAAVLRNPVEDLYWRQARDTWTSKTWGSLREEGKTTLNIEQKEATKRPCYVGKQQEYIVSLIGCFPWPTKAIGGTLVEHWGNSGQNG